MMKNILTLNPISSSAAAVFGGEYRLSPDVAHPVGILVRSFDMHGYMLDTDTVAVARAGAGTNNIPCGEYAAAGVVVFNTPGANANAVNELVIASLLLGSRRLIDAIEWVRTLKGKGDEIPNLVEKGKARFAGPEICGKKLGIVGLGAIGAKVANSAVGLGMEVAGYDPYLSVENAMSLSRQVRRVNDMDTLLADSDYLTFHIPLTDSSRGMIDRKMISKMKDGVVIVNCARGEFADSSAVLEAAASGKIGRYITDFPTEEMIGAENIICIPHLGATTPEAEDNCAAMAARELVDYIENGNIRNSVNYPACESVRAGRFRITVNHLNQQNMIASITSALAGEHINIENLVNKSKGEFAYTMIDTNTEVSSGSIEKIKAIPGVFRVRSLF